MAHERWDAHYWQDRRVLITGHTGFIGSWLSYWLTRLGARVTGYSLAPHTTPSLYDTLALDGALTSIIGDMCDRAALDKAIRAANPEIVIHLAAQAIVGQAHADATETWRVNALGTVTLLEALQGSNTKALTLFTTDKVYDNRETGHAHTEEDAVGGFGMYDSSKGAAELAVRSFVHSHPHYAPTATVRAGNVIGGGDWNQARLVPDCARAFSQGAPVILRHRQSIRPWQHVLDVCYATLKLTERLHNAPEQFRGAWNIGPDAGSVHSAQVIAEHLAPYWQQQPAWQLAANAASYPEANVLLLDSTKLKRALGWQPVLDFTTALDWTAAWYAAPAAQAANITANQLAAFESKLAELR